MEKTLEHEGQVYEDASLICERYKIGKNAIIAWRKRGVLRGIRVGKFWFYDPVLNVVHSPVPKDELAG